MDKTSSGVTFGKVGTVDSCLAANTGKYIFCVPVAQGKRNDRRSESSNADQRIVS